MSDAWTPVHHESLDTDEPGSTRDPQHEASEPGAESKPTKRETQTPIGLTLSLPQDMIDAMWGAAEQLKRVALAIEENTKTNQKLVDMHAATQTRLDSSAG